MTRVLNCSVEEEGSQSSSSVMETIKGYLIFALKTAEGVMTGKRDRVDQEYDYQGARSQIQKMLEKIEKDEKRKNEMVPGKKRDLENLEGKSNKTDDDRVFKRTKFSEECEEEEEGGESLDYSRFIKCSCTAPSFDESNRESTATCRRCMYMLKREKRKKNITQVIPDNNREEFLNYYSEGNLEETYTLPDEYSVVVTTVPDQISSSASIPVVVEEVVVEELIPIIEEDEPKVEEEGPLVETLDKIYCKYVINSDLDHNNNVQSWNVEDYYEDGANVSTRQNYEEIRVEIEDVYNPFISGSRFFECPEALNQDNYVHDKDAGDLIPFDIDGDLDSSKPFYDQQGSMDVAHFLANCLRSNRFEEYYKQSHELESTKKPYKSSHYKKRKSKKNTNRNNGLYDSRFTSSRVESHKRSDLSYKNSTNDDFYIGQNNLTETLNCYDNFEYVIDSNIFPSTQTLNIVYDEYNRATGYIVETNPFYDVDNHNSIELNSAEENAVDLLGKFYNIEKNEVSRQEPQEMLNMEPCSFRFPPEDLTSIYLQCENCKTKPNYEKISNLCLASKFGKFKGLFKGLSEQNVKGVPEKIRPKRKSTVENIEEVKKVKRVNQRKLKRKVIDDKKGEKVKKTKVASVIVQEPGINESICGFIPILMGNNQSVPVDHNRDKKREDPVEEKIIVTHKESQSLIEDKKDINKKKRKRFESECLSNFSKETSATTKKRKKGGEAKKFMCDKCGASFTSSNGRKYHIYNTHVIEKELATKPFSCPLQDCSKKYKSNNGLRYHLRTQHDEGYHNVNKNVI